MDLGTIVFVAAGLLICPIALGGLAGMLLRQLTGRMDVTVYLTEWNDPARHATYSLHQRVDAIK